MLYYSFNNYEGFKEIFGMIQHGNGNKSRRNKILLGMMKDREFFNALRTAHLQKRYADVQIPRKCREKYVSMFRDCDSMADLRDLCLRCFTRFKQVEGYDCDLKLGDDLLTRNVYNFSHPEYEVNNGGICYDGDTRSVRYISHANGGEHVYKMRAGKFMRRLIDASQWSILPECVKVWLCEDFAERWQAYTHNKINEHTLYVSDAEEDFVKIYDRRNYEDDFGSCMSHEGGRQSSFYVDAVKAKAAWMENARGQIVARCVIFTDVEDEDGNKFRLAERQYSSNGDNTLKRILIDKLIAAGEIDGYKQIGVDCHNNRAYVANDGSSWEDKGFSIDCDLNDGDILSYQDSFKWYDYDSNIAYNYPHCDAQYELDTTDGRFNANEGRVWSDYESAYIDEDEATYVESRNGYFYTNDCRWCENTRTEEFFEDCVTLANGDYAYYGRDCEGYDDVYYCECCGEYYLEGDIEYSELLEGCYCHNCRVEKEQEYMEEHCKEEGFRYDVCDEKWYDPNKVSDDIRVLYWDFEKGRRCNGYTRRRNVWMLAQYHNNWYYGNLSMDGAGNKIPHEAA